MNTPTKRERLVAQMGADFAAIAGVGLVVDAAAEEEQQIGKTVGGNGGTAQKKHAIEWGLGDEDPDGVEQVNGLETFDCTLVVVTHLADDKPAGLSWQQYGARIHGLVSEKVMANDGQWKETGTNALLALMTERPGGGMVFVTDLGTKAVMSRFVVRYRHKFGDAGGPA